MSDFGLVPTPVAHGSICSEGNDLYGFRCEQVKPLIQGTSSICLNVGISVGTSHGRVPMFLHDAGALEDACVKLPHLRGVIFTKTRQNGLRKFCHWEYAV